MDDKFSLNSDKKKLNLFGIDEDFVEIVLDINNINKIMMQILYYIEHGNKTFLITYSNENLKYPISKILNKLKVNNLYRLVKEYGVRIYFKGLPRCIYESKILRPGIRWYFEGKITHIEDMGCCDKIHIDGVCDHCYSRESCLGVCMEYKEKFGVSDFVPMFSNEYLYDFNLDEIEKLKFDDLKDVAKELLEDFRNDHFYMRKRFLFVDSFNCNGAEEFVYMINNRVDDLEETYSLLEKFYPRFFLERIKDIIFASNQIVLTFGKEEGKELVKGMYFNINDLSEEVIDELFEETGVDVARNRLWGVGVEFVGDKILNRIYYDHESIKPIELKDFVRDVSLDSKMTFLKFANSLIKPVSSVYLEYRYVDKNVDSRNVLIMLQSNVFKLNQFGILFNLNLSNLIDKELHSMGIEIIEGRKEKIKFYYAVKPEYGELEELEEEE